MHPATRAKPNALETLYPAFTISAEIVKFASHEHSILSIPWMGQIRSFVRPERRWFIEMSQQHRVIILNRLNDPSFQFWIPLRPVQSGLQQPFHERLGDLREQRAEPFRSLGAPNWNRRWTNLARAAAFADEEFCSASLPSTAKLSSTPRNLKHARAVSTGDLTNSSKNKTSIRDSSKCFRYAAYCFQYNVASMYSLLVLMAWSKDTGERSHDRESSSHWDSRRRKPLRTR